MFIEGLNKDGAVTKVGVTNEQRAKVDSKSRPSEEVDAVEGNSYIIHAECHTAAAASGGLLQLLNTSSTQEIVITRVYIDPLTITPTDLTVLQVLSPTVSNGTDVSATAIVQKHQGKANTMGATVVISDGSSNMTYTGGSNYHRFAAKTMTSVVRDMKGTNVVSPNSSIVWGFSTVAGGNATDAEIVSLSINCFVRDKT